MAKAADPRDAEGQGRASPDGQPAREAGAVKEGERKQILLRLSPALWRELAAWAEDDFRSVNGQIEYLLTECVRERKGKK